MDKQLDQRWDEKCFCGWRSQLQTHFHVWCALLLFRDPIHTNTSKEQWDWDGIWAAGQRLMRLWMVVHYSGEKWWAHIHLWKFYCMGLWAHYCPPQLLRRSEISIMKRWCWGLHKSNCLKIILRSLWIP